ncbi:MAG: hypothetical protein P0116_00900 [Candidatus Nitrosocosmicus sp.]|nr:hypothetical protein [Candidatus Nitrosocosmicus sp.]
MYKDTRRSPYRMDAKIEGYNVKNHLIDMGLDCTQETSTQQH